MFSIKGFLGGLYYNRQSNLTAESRRGDSLRDSACIFSLYTSAVKERGITLEQSKSLYFFSLGNTVPCELIYTLISWYTTSATPFSNEPTASNSAGIIRAPRVSINPQ